jgi:glutathione S-transferase
MSDIKLTYFNVKGRGEISRLILAYAGVEYKDERIPMGNGLGNLKASLPYGQVPVLTVDGEQLCQSIAIARYLANVNGLAGTTHLERAQADEIVDTVLDIVVAKAKYFFVKDPTQKAELEADFHRVAATTLGQLEARLKGRGGQFFVGNRFTWADLMVFQVGLEMDAAVLGAVPLIRNLVARVGDMPNIKKYIRDRPETPI